MYLNGCDSLTNVSFLQLLGRLVEGHFSSTPMKIKKAQNPEKSITKETQKKFFKKRLSLQNVYY